MSKAGRGSQWVGGLALLASVVALIFVATSQPGANRSGKNPDPVKSGEPQVASDNGPIGESQPGYVNVGGVFRPKSDVEFAEKPAANRPTPVIDVGLSPPVNPDANPQVRSVAEALKTREHPERFSSFVMPKPFDRAAYDADAEAYLSVVEPARVFQPAEPGPDVTRIEPSSSLYARVTQGEQVALVVKAAAGAPVTFTSFDLGHFDNQLTSTTVRADASGEARALFTAAKGTIDLVEILAASPVTSGQVRFVVDVKLPAVAAR